MTSTYGSDEGHAGQHIGLPRQQLVPWPGLVDGPVWAYMLTFLFTAEIAEDGGTTKVTSAHELYVPG